MMSYERAIDTSTSPSASLTIDASPEHLGVLRALVRTAAAHYPLTLDALTDLVLAADEAASTLVNYAAPRSTLMCTFAVDTDHQLRIGLTATTLRPISNSSSSFGRIVLRTLVDNVAIEQVPTPIDGEWLVTIMLGKAVQPG
ncbi:serine/threonine-protein kinase RsbW [Rhodococcus sp. OAS809]|uniref:ATP-binding protein n=2 Tax=unclassified Rhodococcus (in: high G+C Gram-positive bacteria) TaxID=192944 RepID=UPI0009D3E139|nr:hypothetical protein [Rhodococcus sp. 66b]OQM78775.1 hypothetical protein B0E55_05231 [Rhodococcus sp. 66b]